jgi:hypothetical protein
VVVLTVMRRVLRLLQVCKGKLEGGCYLKWALGFALTGDLSGLLNHKQIDMSMLMLNFLAIGFIGVWSSSRGFGAGISKTNFKIISFFVVPKFMRKMVTAVICIS